MTAHLAARPRTMTPRHGILVIAALGLLAGCASTGTIHGRVQLPNAVTSRTVVTAWPEAEAAPPHVHGRARVVLDGGQFVPSVLVVRPGTEVEFRNRDGVYHAPFSITPAATFDLGQCAPGKRQRFAFERVGVVEVYCALHPKEVLHVVVATYRWHTQPAADGSFSFEHVPDGTYFVRAWDPTAGDVTKRVRVSGHEPALVSFNR